MIGRLVADILGEIRELGSFGIFVARIVRTTRRTHGNLRPVMEQTLVVIRRSAPTVAFAGIFVGAIQVLQFNQMLARYGSQVLLGGLNTSSVVRQVGPLIISFLLAGKIGAFTAAELGTMRITEQIDAIECLGTDPIQYLVVPRFFGIVLSTTVLLTIGLLVSVAGSLGIATAFCGINALEYLGSVPRFIGLWTLFGGAAQAVIYGTIVAGMACYRGFTASGGARGVGRAVRQAAVYTNFYIVIANFITGSVLQYLHQFWETLP